MKKIVLLLGLLFAMQTALMAQDTIGNVTFNAHLLSTFNLNVVTGGVQEIYFNVAADYNDGVTQVVTPPGTGSIIPGFTEITVEATGNWELEILCPVFLGGIGGAEVIPINNLGVWCDDVAGLHKFGAAVTCGYINAATTLGLTITNQLLIGNGTGNAGDISDNSFALHWRMGTTDNGTMNLATMFDQMAVPDFTTGDYTTTAILTLHAL
jgi:hypothetical protein